MPCKDKGKVIKLLYEFYAYKHLLLLLRVQQLKIFQKFPGISVSAFWIAAAGVAAGWCFPGGKI